MRANPLALVAALALASAPLVAQDLAAERRLLLVSIDGLAPASYLEPDAQGLAIPHLRALSARGAAARGVTGVLPTVTYPIHTTLLTGVPPRVHGILGNQIFDPERKSNQAWHWYADEVRVPTLLSAAYRAGRITGAIGWPVTVGLEIDALVPEFWRTGSSHPADKRLLEQLSSTSLFAEVEAKLGAPLPYPFTDRERTELALHVLATRKPHLLAVHFVDHDFAQHDFGPDSAQARAALERVDAELGRLLAALDELGLSERTLVVVVSDHGFVPVARELRPNTLLRRAGLLEVDGAGRPTSWRAQFGAHGGTALLHLAEPGDTGTLAAVRRLFEQRAAEPGAGLRAVLGAPEIAALGGDPAANPLALDAREGFHFGDAAEGDWGVPARQRGHHGHAPVRPEMESALIVAGPGLTARGDLGTVSILRIAPTLARYLGLELAAEAGEPLRWLAPPAP